MIEREAALIESETKSILDAIFAISGTAFWESIFRAFQLGYLDVPFAPHADNANRLLSVRDGNGSIRIAAPAAVPISSEDAQLEKELLESQRRPRRQDLPADAGRHKGDGVSLASEAHHRQLRGCR